MKPLNPAPICSELTLWFYQLTGWIIPPSCWAMGVAMLFLCGMLAISMGVRYWIDPKDSFP